MYILVNPRKGKLDEPSTVVMLKGNMGVDNNPLLLSEETLQVEKCDLLDFKRKVGDCSNIRNVYLADNFYTVMGDDPYKELTSPFSCSNGALVIQQGGGRAFSIAEKGYKIEASGSEIYLNGKGILEMPAPGDFEDIHLMYPFRHKNTLYLRYIATTVNRRAGMLTLIFDMAGHLLDSVGYGACPLSPKDNAGRIRAFTDGSALF